jgi:predicted kinase
MIICPDNFRVTPDGKYDPSPAASELAWKECFALLDKALQAAGCLKLLMGIPGAGKSTWAQYHDAPTIVVFDATFSRRIERKPLIEIGKAVGVVSVEAVVFLTPISECIRRNWTRPEDRRVPYPVIASMHENMRREPVTLDEGFDCIRVVRP